MKRSTVLLIAGAVAIPIAGFAYYQHVKSNYDISFQDVIVKSIDGGNINLDVRFLITNQTGMRLTVSDSKFIIYGNGVPIGIAQQPAPLIIPNNMITTMVANVIVNKENVQSAAFDFLYAKIFGHGSSGVQLNIQGIAKVQINAPVLSMFTVNIAVDESYSL